MEKWRLNVKVDFEFSTPEAERDYKKFKKAMDEKKKNINMHGKCDINV